MLFDITLNFKMDTLLNLILKQIRVILLKSVLLNLLDV